MRKIGLKESIIDLRKKGLSYNIISKELNCAKSTVSYYCKNDNQLNSIKNEDFTKDLSLDTISKVIELKNNNKTYEEILEKVDISKDKLKKICRQIGINISIKNYKKDAKLILEMQNYYNECKSSLKVSERFNISKKTVLKYIKTEKRGKRNEEQRKKDVSTNVISWRKRTKIKLVNEKGGKCEICGYDKCISALTFHHTNPKEKDFNISAKSYSFERLKNEIDKCILVCSNCHIEIHGK